MGKRVIFTGGSGVAGRWVVKELLERGHNILNLDVANSLDNPKVHTLRCDVTNAGQVFSAMHTAFRVSEPLELSRVPDAVIHFAGIPRPVLAPDNEVLRSNVLGFINVVEAACKLGIRKIILASSVTVYGVSYAEGPREFSSFPVDEKVDCCPTDPYAISKLIGERIARGFAARFGIDIYCLRIGRVIEPADYPTFFESYVSEPEKWAVHGWSYTDVRDLGQMCHRALETDGLGFQVFNATNDSTTNNECTTAFLQKLYPHIPFTRPMGDREAPMSNKKIKDLLGFREDHPWRKHFQNAPLAKL